MQIVVVGLNHETAPVEVREKLAFSKSRLGEALDQVRACDGVSEGVIVSTCNRVEICAVVRDVAVGFKTLQQFLEQIHHQKIQAPIDPYLYRHASQDAVRHLFRVACSLDSMVVGESQILGQVKQAFEEAVGRNATGVILNRLFRKTISVAKRVRTETRISESTVSVSSTAVELACRIFDRMDETTVMLMGSGEMAELAARHLVNRGVQKIRITGRNHERTCELAAAFRGTAVPYDSLFGELSHADIVICSTGAPHYLVTVEQMRTVIQVRKNRPIFLIDLSVPRNIDPGAKEIDNVYLYDIDDLKTVVEANRKQREREAQKAERIVEQEVLALCRWLKSLDVVPTIVALREMAEDIRQTEVRKGLSQHSNLPPATREALEGVTQSIVNKLLHSPLIFLKQEANASNGSLYLDAVRRLFNLDGEFPTRQQTKDHPADLPLQESENGKIEDSGSSRPER